MDEEEKVTLKDVDKRLTNVERVLLSIQAQLTPRWLRIGAWGAFAGAMLKELLFK
jgi:hypothetical protein